MNQRAAEKYALQSWSIMNIWQNATSIHWFSLIYLINKEKDGKLNGKLRKIKWKITENQIKNAGKTNEERQKI